MSENKHNFVSAFPNWVPFIYFPCLIALARTSNRMMRVDIPALIPNLKGKSLSVSVLNISCRFFLHGFSYFDTSHFRDQRTNVRVLQTATNCVYLRAIEMTARWVHKPNESLWGKHKLGILLLPGSCSCYFNWCHGDTFSSRYHRQLRFNKSLKILVHNY